MTIVALGLLLTSPAHAADKAAPSVRPVPQASIPWKREVAAPVPANVPLAVVPRIGTLAHPDPADVPLALVPYLPLQQSSGLTFVTIPLRMVGPNVPQRNLRHPEAAVVALAEVPLAYALVENRQFLVTLPPQKSPIAFMLRNPAVPSPAQVETAEVSFEDPAHRRRSPLVSPLATDERKDQDKFIVALAKDHRGRIWIGTEDQGVWCFDPTASEGQHWRGFSVKDGLGDDNAYAITCDLLGRIWVGHLHHGVSVFNGAIWKNYDSLAGPLGERVFAMTTNPVDGDVWIATNAGLARYGYKKDTWSYYTRAEGLPSDQASSLAFDKAGTLYVGTQCDGIAIGQAADDYKKWQVVHAPKEYHDRVPLVPKGSGLPTDLINDVLATRDGTVYAATTTGLAWSKDRGLTWQFTRGQDWADKVRGLYGGAPKAWKETPGAQMQEDYLTCLAEDEAGMLWVGTRQSSYEILDPRTGLHQRVPAKRDAEGKTSYMYIGSILPRTGQTALIGQYQGGMAEAATYFVVPAEDRPADSQRIDAAVAFPTPAPAPSLADLQRLLAEMARVQPAAAQDDALVLALPPDWTTQGEWLGRYGRSWIALSACLSPADFIWGTQAEQVKYSAGIGPHHDKGDSIRYWVHWNHTQNPRSLELPSTYLDSRVQKKLTTWSVNRRQAEWDDHGEAYPQTKDGPHLYCNLAVPEGVYVLSLYNMNKDGHGGNNRFRDYRISIREQATGKALQDLSGFDDQPELARARCRDFWGGMYTRFLVRGPRHLTIQIHRNYSFNTILAGVMLDRVEECPVPYFGFTGSGLPQPSTFPAPVPTALGTDPRPDMVVVSPTPASEAEAVEAIRKTLAALEASRPVWHHAEGRRYYAALARWYQQALTKPDAATSYRRALATCYYQLQRYASWEEQQAKLGLVPARQIEQALRWDGKAKTYPGENCSLVTAYRAARGTQTMDPVRGTVIDNRK